MTTQSILFCFSLGITFSLSFFQTRQLFGRGSDHHNFLFLARVIRENNHRLFVFIPRILNVAHCGASPLFLHWTLSFLTQLQIIMVSRFLNAIMSCLIVASVFTVAQQFTLTAGCAGWASLAIALTPQSYHAYNARNYGLSTRSIGVFLFTIVSLYLPFVSGDIRPWIGIILLTLAGYLIWGFSTFGVQTLLLLAVPMGLLFKDWRLLELTAVSAVVFMILHPRYGTAYIKYTFSYIYTYATDTSSVFGQKYRYSIWRDLVLDIWQRLAQKPSSGLSYAYENAVVIAGLLNPFLLAALAIAIFERPTERIFIDWHHLIVSGAIVFFLTTFKITRFLGEPERYLEMVTPMATLVVVQSLWSAHRMTELIALLCYSGVFCGVQLLYGWVLSRRLNVTDTQLLDARKTIEESFGNEPVRFASNDEQLTKFMMTAPWQFIRIFTGDQKFLGLRMRDVFTVFPFFNKEPFEQALRLYRINACVLNKKSYSDIFEGSPDHQRLTLLSESDFYRVYRIRWE